MGAGKLKVKEQKVELIELFYDLIYVYAISQLTSLIVIPADGHIPVLSYLRYLVAFFAILQSWLYMTNYVNRYGQWRWYEYTFTILNMISAVYLSNTISNNWDEYYVAFNGAMLLCLLTVAAQYIIQLRVSDDPGAVIYFLKILGVTGSVYILAILFIQLGLSNLAMVCNVIAVLCGAFLPFVIRSEFDIQIISFPHLAERFELLTIITFGEAIVGMTGYFDVKNLSFLPILIFAVIITLFGSYVVQIHYLMNHHRVARSLRLMFTHYFIVIAINLMTVGIHLLHDNNSIPAFVPLMIILAEVMFYVAMLQNSAYYSRGYYHTRRGLLILAAFQLIGAVLILRFRYNIYGIILGMLEMALAGFIYLLTKFLRGVVK